MATAAVGFAPVVTPRTIGALVNNLEQAQMNDIARSLRSLQPFVERVVADYFEPLTKPARKSAFPKRFTKLANAYTAPRLYINLKLISNFRNLDFLGIYELALQGVLDSLMNKAREMEMAPDLVSAAVHDYAKILKALLAVGATINFQNADLTVDQISSLAEWLNRATRFDYGLTATFLVLEGAISMPAPQEKAALLLACKRTLTEFAQATSRIFAWSGAIFSVESLDTPHIEIMSAQKRFRVIPSRRESMIGNGPVYGTSRRTAEISWLTKNKELSEQYGGQWIVLEKNELVANDKDYQKVRAAAIKRGLKRPFIIFVPPKETGGFMGI